MAPKAPLKPFGPLAQLIGATAQHPPAKPNPQKALKALQDELPELDDILGNSAFDQLMTQIVKSTDRMIVGEELASVLMQLQHGLTEAGLRLTTKDYARCLDKILQLRTKDGGLKFRAVVDGKGGPLRAEKARQGYVSAVAGELRERKMLHLAPTRELAIALRAEAKQVAKSIEGGSLFDSALHGDVRMPSAAIDGGRPVANKLATDRLIGVLTHDKAAQKLGFAGTIHVTAAIEVKAITGGLQGVAQLQNLFVRASHGQVTVNGKTYRIVLDDKRLRRVLILPETAQDSKLLLSEAERLKVEVMPYPAWVEAVIQEQADFIVEALIKHDRLLR